MMPTHPFPHNMVSKVNDFLPGECGVSFKEPVGPMPPQNDGVQTPGPCSPWGQFGRGGPDFIFLLHAVKIAWPWPRILHSPIWEITPSKSDLP